MLNVGTCLSACIGDPYLMSGRFNYSSMHIYKYMYTCYMCICFYNIYILFIAASISICVQGIFLNPAIQSGSLGLPPGLQRMIRDPLYEVFFTVVVMANAVFIGVETQHSIDLRRHAWSPQWLSA